ncbi:MAG TPA: quinonprotein alcohol dehydrogenase [Verrucomicrobiales bacterium]|nr:quinonprotein alcohol dehydrogenase [Verrucomicrobiales bacterium]
MGGVFMMLTGFVSGDWPQFRGATGQGIAEARDLPLHWSETKNVRWKTPIRGRAWSSPVVGDGRIWLTTATEDGKELSVVCLDQESGEILIERKLFDVEDPQFAHRFNTYASPTPVLEGNRVYLTFGSPGIACIDAETAKVIWQRRDFVCNHFRGAGASPILYKDLLILPFDGSDFQFIVGLDKQTGKTIWNTKRSVDYQDLDPKGNPKEDGDWRKAYSTPIISNLSGRDLLISLGSKAVYAYEPETGKEIWQMVDRKAHSGSVMPFYGGGRLYYCTGFPKGKLNAVKPGGSGEITATHLLWSVRRNIPNKPSPLFHEGLIFMIDDGGIASCLDAETGEEIWRERVGGNYSASPLLVGDRVYFFSEEGKTAVVKAGREFVVIAENQLDDGFMASPAVVENALFLRTKKALYRIQN